jgi:exosortase/archaeosortase family protein
MKKNEKKQRAKNIFIRYAITLLVAIPNLWLFYFILTPLTIYPTYFLLKLTYGLATLDGNMITLIVNQEAFPIKIVASCVAGSAYYLLFILNMSLPKIKLNQRLKMISFAFLAFFAINILRIFTLSIIAVNGSSFFDITHTIFWYSLSTLFVVGIWFSQVRYFKIKEIPFYSDVKFLYNHSAFKK